MEQQTIKADVLCIGAGIAGLMAGIRASELGAKVIIIDKAGNPIRSGCSGMGNDHFQCYIPEVHGPDIEAHINEFQHSQQGSLRNRDFIRTWLETSFEIVKLWDNWGIPMKYQGKWEFAGHALPDGLLTHLHYAGLDQKKILVEQARQRGATIMGGLTGYELLHNNGIISGALAIDKADPRAIVFEAPAVILGTGGASRIWPSSTPAYMFNTRRSPINVGDGRAMAYRAGADLASLELEMYRCGPKYLARAGKATWVGVCRDGDGKAVGPFVSRPDTKYGDPIVDVYQGIFADYARQGKGPIYMDCKGLTDDEYAYMVHWMKNEGFRAILDEMDKEGLDFRNNVFEFGTYELTPRGGVLYNQKGETSLRGLYAAGDEFTGGISGAAVFGWIAGESASKYSSNAKLQGLEGVKEYVSERIGFLEEILTRKTGPDWQESNIALQQLMEDYCGSLRSEKSLTAGLMYLTRLKDKVHKTLVARNQHELMRCIEVLNIIDLGELIMTAALERRESREAHRRADYPYANRMLEKLLVVNKKAGKPVASWRVIGQS
ncbi:MAG: FAD-binding protein [Syntrophales bacterium]|jgi:succinate dehydrogenase/fumarate reductase flavoprotein subunit|nr:FAD-binding protein [Syntrophales bacterium]